MTKFLSTTLSLVILMSYLGCGKFLPHDDSPNPDTRLQDKFNLYLKLAPSEQDSEGFILTKDCDSLLYSSLEGIFVHVNIEAARDSSGKWYRRPLNLYPECYSSGDSGSTISRDMFVGLLWNLWRNKRLALAEDLFQYGLNHNWIMGDGDVSRTYFAPGLQATLAEIIYRLGGDNHSVYRSIPQVYTHSVSYAAQLDVLHVLLRGELLGFIDSSALDVLEYNYKRVPGNALFAYGYHRYTDGNQAEATNGLLNEQYFPAQRLPQSGDRCTPWLFTFDPGQNWEPCAEDLTHPGGDLIFVSGLILGK